MGRILSFRVHSLGLREDPEASLTLKKPGGKKRQRLTPLGRAGLAGRTKSTQEAIETHLFSNQPSVMTY